MKPQTIIGIGAAIAVLTDLWWYEEVAGRLGKVDARGALSCLVQLGTGNCSNLWFVGLHQENLIASVVFWGGVAAAVYGLWQLVNTKGRRTRWPSN
jgi:hypothetical protein